MIRQNVTKYHAFYATLRNINISSCNILELNNSIFHQFSIAFMDVVILDYPYLKVKYVCVYRKMSSLTAKPIQVPNHIQYKYNVTSRSQEGSLPSQEKSHIEKITPPTISRQYIYLVRLSTNFLICLDSLLRMLLTLIIK